MTEEIKRRGEWLVTYNVHYENRPSKTDNFVIYHVGDLDEIKARELVKNILEAHTHKHFSIKSIEAL